jgi:hypothetical protein
MLIRMVVCAVAEAMNPRPRLRQMRSFESFMLSPESNCDKNYGLGQSAVNILIIAADRRGTCAGFRLKIR